ncbi:MAG: InlB B-repeat-containing protein, partial [Mogibacterium sp.]|nr:InlB B-repeat-containing protein [Mogibacterium sp.]
MKKQGVNSYYGEPSFKWKDVGPTNIKKLCAEWNNPTHISGIEKERRYSNRKFFAIVMALLLLVQMQPFSFVFAEDGSDAPKAETSSTEVEKKSVPAPKAEPKPEPKPEPAAEPEVKEEPAAEPETPEAEVKEEPAAEPETPEAEESTSSDESQADEETQDAADADVAAEEETPTEEEKEEYPAQTLTANAGGVTVTLKAPEGALPEGSKLKAKQVGQKYIDAVESQIGELRDAVAIDVTPVNKDGKEIQPKKTVAVTFSGANLEMESGDEVEVFRVSDDASSVTDMNGSGNANTQSFNTKHFTIYVTGTNPHETHEQNTEAGRYVLEYGESVYLTDDNDSSADNWTASTGASYVELSDRTTTSLTVKNVNSTNNDQVVAIRHGSYSRTYRYFYITAKAKPRTHNVTYDPKGGKIDGSTNPKTVTVDDGTTIQLPAAPTDKDNYTFAGWKTGSQTYDAGADYTVSADVSFDAQWTADKYSISYSYAGGTAPKTANPTEYTVEDNINISNEPSRTGYTFTGWTSNDMSTPITTPTTPVNWSAGSESGNKTFTANWEIVDYDITYDYDDGTAPSTDNPTKYTVADRVEISNEPTKEGYTFKGWTSEDMSTPITTPTTPVNWSAGAESGNKTFTANWETVKYGITYYYDGGTAPQTANPTEYTVEDSVNISNEPTKEDYTFIGWTGSGIDEPRKTISWTAGAEKGPKSYTANWALTEYSITYELDGGDASSAENPEKYTVAYDVEISDEPTKEGYTFKGWTSDDMSTPITTPTTPVNWSAGDERGNKTFTANWEAVEYDIAYNYAGGEEPAEPNPIKYTIEDSIEISKEPTKAGYIFAGWTSFDTHPKIDTPTTPVEWSAGAEYGNKTFTANWKKQVTLTYELNSGTQQATLIPDIRTITLGEGDKIDLATATFTGHQFEEWNTKEDGTGSHHSGGSEYTMPDHDVTLWAQWTEHPITVTYNYNYSGATEPWKKVSAPENDPYYQVVNEKPTRDEYLFVGWSTTKGATKTSEIEYFPGSNLPTAQEDIELYAVWVMEENEAREYTQILKGFGKEVYYTGEEQKIVPKEITAYMGGTAYIGVSSVDNPKSESAGNPDYKYAGYVRVGKKTDGDPAWHNVYAFVKVDSSTEINGTDAGVYNGPMAAPLYAHEEGAEMDGFVQLTTTDSAGNEDFEYIEVTNNQLIIKPVPIVITTNSAKKAHDGKALTAGGEAVIGASDDPAGQTTADLVPGTNPVTLRNGEKVVITIDGSQTDLGSSKNNATVHWNQTSGGAKQQNYTVTKNLGTLTVYDFTAEFYKNTEDDVHGMPSDWEGDIQPPGSRVYTLPTNEPTRAHSKFEGWTTDSEGTGTVYQPGGSYTYPDDETDVKFYAKWSEEVDIVTYDPNGGVFDGKTRPTEIPCAYDESHTIREAATRNYYDFVEWNTKKDGSGDKYSPSATYTIKGDVTFYAQWTPKTYTITYNYDGGVKPAEDNPSSYTVEQGVSITKKPTRKGYTFTGWTGSGITEPQETISWNAGEENGNKEYTANWKADEYTISYSYAGGDAPAKDNPTKYTVNDKVSISNEPTRKGYTFTGWTGSGIDNPQKKISWNAGDETGNKSYTANWTLDQYSISYDYAGGVSPSTPNPTEYTVEDET